MKSFLIKAVGIGLAAMGPIIFAGAMLPAAAQAAPAPGWAVNMAASRLTFQSSMGGEAFTGQFQRWRADIRFDPQNLPASSVLVKVDMTSARTGSSERDEALPGDDWFAAGKFGVATFAAKTFKDLGGGRYQAIGTLTMRGVTRPLALAFMLKIQGDQARMEGNTMIDRHVFGVGQGQFAGADSIPFAVNLRVSLAAKRM
ncbi:polyisoprenoid-binding protein YceI [Sphingomonas vulcanisoli]|uniref:Polyisoprenoid-binding protein YceI n=1 Tax=Sphingomonas vulcanisoli TaxID=1658060 RepID=A0ABX0TVF7_9SPHN|nr:YceI family protein [Sphingomonas vulcanisoli]NIJ09497.1 polyisoprenoid-binding protein YceI [Sphingomonas vulcanisoli]